MTQAENTCSCPQAQALHNQRKQVVILISISQVLQILYLKHYEYKTYENYHG